jgi:SET domain-containing protein
MNTALTNAAQTKLKCRPSKIQGQGLFAVTTIERGTRVIEYVGEKIDGIEMVRRCAAGNHFIFGLGDGYYIDGALESNFARLINHSCEPNCEILWDDGRIWIVARRDVRTGEEITFNYSYDLENYRQYPCHCGSLNCAGYIVAEEFFDHVRSQTELRHAHA